MDPPRLDHSSLMSGRIWIFNRGYLQKHWLNILLVLARPLNSWFKIRTLYFSWNYWDRCYITIWFWIFVLKFLIRYPRFLNWFKTYMMYFLESRRSIPVRPLNSDVKSDFDIWPGIFIKISIKFFASPCTPSWWLIQNSHVVFLMKPLGRMLYCNLVLNIRFEIFELV